MTELPRPVPYPPPRRTPAQVKPINIPLGATVANDNNNAVSAPCFSHQRSTAFSQKRQKKKYIWVRRETQQETLKEEATTTTSSPLCIGPTTNATLLHKNYRVDYDSRQRFTVESHVTAPEESGLVRNQFKAFHKRSQMQLTEGAKKILTLPNAGGNSVWSEVLSFDILGNMFYGKLLKTEMELEYWPMGCKITDYSMEMFGQTVGVSVTRAMKYNGTFDANDAHVLLTKKLGGVNESSKCVVPEHSWKSQILHIWATHDYIADEIEKKWKELSAELKSNTMIIVTVVSNAGWIFREDYDDELLFETK